MKREIAEKVIGNCLEIIRAVCQSAYENFDHCSMYVTDHSISAVILDGDEDDGEYLLNIHRLDEEGEGNE